MINSSTKLDILEFSDIRFLARINLVLIGIYFLHFVFVFIGMTKFKFNYYDLDVLRLRDD
jgi:hypothetical protein